MRTAPSILALALAHCAAHQRSTSPQPFAGTNARDAPIAALAEPAAPAAAVQGIELAPSARALWSVVRDQPVELSLRNESIRSITSTRSGAVYVLLAQSPPVGAEATLVQIEPDHIETFPTRPGTLLASDDELSLLTTHHGLEPPNVRDFDRARGFYRAGTLLRIDRSTANESALLTLGGGQRPGWRIGSSRTFERDDRADSALRFDGRAIAMGVDQQQRPWIVSESDRGTIDWTRDVASQWTRSTLYAQSADATGCAGARCAVEQTVLTAIAHDNGLLVVRRETLGSRERRCTTHKPAPCARCRTAPMPAPVCRDQFVAERSWTSLERRTNTEAARLASLPASDDVRIHADTQGTIHLALLSRPSPTRAELRYAAIARAPNAPRASAIAVREPARNTRVERPASVWDLIIAGWSASGELVRDREVLTGDGFGQVWRELRVGERFTGRARYLERCGFGGLTIDLRGERPAELPWSYTLALRTDALVLRAGSSQRDAAPAEGYVDAAFAATQPHEYAIERTADAIVTSVDQRQVSRVALRIDSPVILRLATPTSEVIQWLDQARPAPRDCASVPPSAISWSVLDWIRR